MAKTVECIHSMDKLWNVYTPWLNCGMYTFNEFSCWKYTFHGASHGIWIRYSIVTQIETRMYYRAHNFSTSPILSISNHLVALYCSTDFFNPHFLLFSQDLIVACTFQQTWMYYFDFYHQAMKANFQGTPKNRIAITSLYDEDFAILASSSSVQTAPLIISYLMLLILHMCRFTFLYKTVPEELDSLSMFHICQLRN